jgi:fucose permease
LSLAVNIWSFFVKAQPNDPPFPTISFRNAHTPLKTICWFSAMISFYVVAELLIGTRLVLLSRREWGVDANHANQLLSLFYFLLLSGRLVMSFWHFNIKTKNLLLTSILLSFVLFSVGVLTHPLIIALCGLPMSIFFPCSIAFVYEEQPVGADNIIAWTLAWNAGAILMMHWLIGWISDVASLKIAILVGPASLLICLSLLLSEKFFVRRRA